MRMIAFASLLIASSAYAQQQQRFYGPDGRSTGSISTDSRGNATYYDSAGRLSGKSSVGSNGTTTFYNADGKRSGTLSPNLRRNLNTGER